MSINTRTELVMQDAGASSPTRNGLLFVDGRPFMRDCLVRWLSGEMPDLAISVLSDATHLPQEPAASVPAIALLFLAGPGAHAENWLRDQVEILRSRDEDMPIALLVDVEHADRADGMVEAMGLQGYIPTSSSAGVVRAALRLVLAGGTYLPRTARRSQARFEETLRPAQAEAAPGEPAQPKLTPREDRVLELLAKGLPNKITAYRLGMSVSTVKVHVHHLIQKLHAQNRTELAILAPSFRAARPSPSGQG